MHMHNVWGDVSRASPSPPPWPTWDRPPDERARQTADGAMRTTTTRARARRAPRLAATPHAASSRRQERQRRRWVGGVCLVATTPPPPPPPPRRDHHRRRRPFADGHDARMTRCDANDVATMYDRRPSYHEVQRVPRVAQVRAAALAEQPPREDLDDGLDDEAERQRRVDRDEVALHRRRTNTMEG